MLRQEDRGDFKLDNSWIMSHVNYCLWPYVMTMGKPRLLSSLRRNGTYFTSLIKSICLFIQLLVGIVGRRLSMKNGRFWEIIIHHFVM